MLKGKVCKTDELKETDLNSMFLLMSDYYANIKKENFINDFIKKENAIVLFDENNNIQLVVNRLVKNKKVMEFPGNGLEPVVSDSQNDM